MTLSGIRSPLEFRVFHINGIALHVVLAGPASGKPLIFLHGFPEFWFAWRLQIDHFVSSGYRVIIPDQRGYNLSDKPAGIASYSIDLLARDVVGVLDTVADSKAFVVGHDWGAGVAWYLAARYSDKQYKKSWAKKGALTAMLNWYRAALLRPSKFALDSNASRVKVPALLIWGKNDQFTGEAMARESLQYCDDGHLEMFETATHWVQHEEPAQVNTLLSQFFA